MDGTGPSLSLRLSKKEGAPIQLVAEGTPGASVVAVKRMDELGFYSLGAKQLAEKIGLRMPKAVAVVDHLGLRDLGSLAAIGWCVAHDPDIALDLPATERLCVNRNQQLVAFQTSDQPKSRLAISRVRQPGRLFSAGEALR